MLEEYVRLVERLFPSIDPYTAENCIRAIRQHGQNAGPFAVTPLADTLAQGDVLGPVSLYTTDADGAVSVFEGSAMLLSNTCDAEHDDFVILAVCFPFAVFAADGRLPAIITNETYDLMYLRSVPQIGDIVIDLARVSSVSRTFLVQEINGGRTRRVASLSSLGFWFFLSKLTVHLMRPESRDVNRIASPAG